MTTGPQRGPAPGGRSPAGRGSLSARLTGLARSTKRKALSANNAAPGGDREGTRYASPSHGTVTLRHEQAAERPLLQTPHKPDPRIFPARLSVSSLPLLRSVTFLVLP